MFIRKYKNYPTPEESQDFFLSSTNQLSDTDNLVNFCGDETFHFFKIKKFEEASNTHWASFLGQGHIWII